MKHTRAAPAAPRAATAAMMPSTSRAATPRLITIERSFRQRWRFFFDYMPPRVDAAVVRRRPRCLRACVRCFEALCHALVCLRVTRARMLMRHYLRARYMLYACAMPRRRCATRY